MNNPGNLSTVPVQLEFPMLGKIVRINMNTRSTIKQHLALFGSKFDIDFSAFQVNVNLRVNKERKRIPIDVPIRLALEEVAK